MRQKIRRTVILLFLLLLPITLNYFSPYVSLSGAIIGIVSGSLLLFMFLFIGAIFFGRAWCAWVCPMAGLSEAAKYINHRNVNVKRLRIVRYSIFAIWFVFIIIAFILAGGITAIDPLYLTDNIISVDSPDRYILYYGVLILFSVLTLLLGKRGACHSICWMAPFLTAGYHVGRLFKVPQLRIETNASKCIDCKICDRKCPMSIYVSRNVKNGYILTSECILCGECVDGCSKGALRYTIKKNDSKQVCGNDA